MADDKEEKLIASALQTVFKNAKIPVELYERRQYELKVDDAEVVKVNLTLKRGLVLDIEEDSNFRTFLNINDIVLTVNDKVANKPDFKLHDLFKEKGCKSFVFTYVRMKWAPDERPALEESERKDGYNYLVFALFHYQRVPIGLILQSFQGAKVMVMEVALKTIGAMCLLPGDCILQLNGVRLGSDAAKTLDTMAQEIEQKGFARITIERPTSEVAKATANFTIQSEHRDLPVPADCAAYIKDAMKRLKDPEPKSILKAPKQSGADEPDAKQRVGFHERIHAESVIPSDIADELLIKTPNRVPGVTIASPLQMPMPPPSPISAPAPETDKEPSLIGKAPTMDAPPTPQKEKKNKNQVSKKSTVEPKNSKGSRKKASAEVIKNSSKSGKSAVEGKGGKGKPKKKSKQGGGNNTLTGGDTEGAGGTGH